MNENMLESNPLKSRLLVCGLAVKLPNSRKPVSVCALPTVGTLASQAKAGASMVWSSSDLCQALVTVSSHNLNLQHLNSRVSNPRTVAYVHFNMPL